MGNNPGRGLTVKRFRVVPLVLAIAVSVGVSGCGTGKVLTLPGDLARPEQWGAGQTTAAGPLIAVADFTFAGDPPHEIGRDFDRARAIVWEGDPGMTMADLIADVLREKGFRSARVSPGEAVPADAVARVWGSVDRFHVEIRKKGSLRVTAESAASVAVTVYGTGGNAPPNWNSTIASDFWTEDPLFVTSAGVQGAVGGAANAVAEEAVRRLVAAGVVPGWEPPPRPGRGGR